MSSESKVEQLQRELEILKHRLEIQERDSQYLRDRLAIQDCVMRHARGVDRHDVELMNSCYHEDGVARYGPAVVPGPQHGRWSNNAHTGRFGLHLHSIATQNCEIDGDTAYCESYVLATFLSPDQKRASLVAGRYFDQLQRLGGEWKIAVRRTVIDICLEGDASFLGAFRGREIDESDFWSKKDPSYRRPLDVETPVPGWH
jgi:hypothetical protein